MTTMKKLRDNYGGKCIQTYRTKYINFNRHGTTSKYDLNGMHEICNPLYTSLLHIGMRRNKSEALLPSLRTLAAYPT
jgi:hypothetical protein